MNPELTSRAEALLLLQECEIPTDSKTLRAAVILAHHGTRFQTTSNYWKPFFQKMAEMMREKFPACPCIICIEKEKAAIQAGKR